MDTLPLALAITNLRDELTDAIETAQTKNLKFAIETVELTLQLAVTKGSVGSAGAGLWGVVTIEGSRESANARTHQVTLTLRPRLEEGDKPSADVLVGDKDGVWSPMRPQTGGER